MCLRQEPKKKSPPIWLSFLELCVGEFLSVICARKLTNFERGGPDRKVRDEKKKKDQGYGALELSFVWRCRKRWREYVKLTADPCFSYNTELVEDRTKLTKLIASYVVKQPTEAS